MGLVPFLVKVVGNYNGVRGDVNHREDGVVTGVSDRGLLVKT